MLAFRRPVWTDDLVVEMPDDGVDFRRDLQMLISPNREQPARLQNSLRFRIERIGRSNQCSACATVIASQLSDPQTRRFRRRDAILDPLVRLQRSRSGSRSRRSR